MKIKSKLINGGKDLLVISGSGVSFYHLETVKQKLEIQRKFVINSDIYKRGIFGAVNFEKAIAQLKEKHPHLGEVGVILNIPGLIFLKLNMPLVKTHEAILNYLQTNIPIPLVKYYIITRQSKKMTGDGFISVDVYLFPKTVIDSINLILLKHNIIPLFIVHVATIIDLFARYSFVLETDVDYFFVFQSQEHLVSLFINNYDIQKILSDEIDSNNWLDKFNKVLNYIAGFTNKRKEIIAIFENEGQLPTKFQLKKISLTLDQFWASTYEIVEKELFSQNLVDLMPEKPLNFYLINKLIPSFKFLSVFLLAVSFVFVIIGSFFTNFLTNKVNKIQLPIIEKEVGMREQQLSEMNNLMDLYLKRYGQTIPISFLEKIVTAGEIEMIEAAPNNLKIFVIIKETSLENIKNLVEQYLPGSKLTTETKNNLLRLVIEK